MKTPINIRSARIEKGPFGQVCSIVYLPHDATHSAHTDSESKARACAEQYAKENNLTLRWEN